MISANRPFRNRLGPFRGTLSLLFSVSILFINANKFLSWKGLHPAKSLYVINLVNSDVTIKLVKLFIWFGCFYIRPEPAKWNWDFCADAATLRRRSQEGERIFPLRMMENSAVKWGGLLEQVDIWKCYYDGIQQETE